MRAGSSGRVTRRRLLRTVATGGVATAGCVGLPGWGERTETEGDGTGSGAASQTAAESTGTSATAELDLREANVMDVTVERVDAGVYDVAVTLYHDDDGESGYADWWQVETRGGEQLGRRTLRHAHGTRRFTRSKRLEFPGDVDCAVVRGHDQTHGYGGRAMLVTLASGATKPVDQGSARQSMAEMDCP